MNHAELLLSRVIDNNDVGALKRFSIEADHLYGADRKALEYITEYAEHNRGQAPSYATISGDVEGFNYIPDVSDSFEWLAGQVKKQSGFRLWYEKLIGTDEDKKRNKPSEFEEIFNKKDPELLDEWLLKTSESIKMRTSVRNEIGKDLTQLKNDFREEYKRRKEGRSFKMWETPFKALNKEIGGFYSGDIYGVMAESGRGKSYLIIAFVDALLRQGANVLVKSFELKAYLWLSRLFSIMTAVDETLTDNEGRKVGIPNKEILTGKLNEDYETYFLTLVDTINEYYPGNLVLQAKGDDELTRSISDLDKELHTAPEIDVVVVDPIYGFSDVYGRNSNKTTGGAAEQAARYFEQVIGKHDVVGIYAVQATVEKKQGDDEGNRELRLPDRSSVKTSKALLEIATNLFSFDSCDNLAMLGVEKGRNGSEDYRLELTALLDYGVLREMPTGDAVAGQFTGVF
jgi:hypothetical protein